jgi:hypothetical protein
MAPLSESVRRWQRERPNQLPALALGFVVIAASIWVGLQAKSVAASLAQKGATWQQTASQLAALQQQFRVPSSFESAALITESARAGALGVPASDRVSLIEYLARLADASALSEVRVNFKAGMDSAFIPPRVIGADPISPAAYSVTVDFTGSFVGLVQFVSSLPPSVSVSRMGAARNGGHAAYHVVLSVYELPNGNNGG